VTNLDPDKFRAALARFSGQPPTPPTPVLVAYSLAMARGFRDLYGRDVRIFFRSDNPDRPARVSEIPGVAEARAGFREAAP
jgi:hypothetical protein